MADRSMKRSASSRRRGALHLEDDHLIALDRRSARALHLLGHAATVFVRLFLALAHVFLVAPQGQGDGSPTGRASLIDRTLSSAKFWSPRFDVVETTRRGA